LSWKPVSLLELVAAGSAAGCSAACRYVTIKASSKKLLRDTDMRP
jgi:hypothetical protein